MTLWVGFTFMPVLVPEQKQKCATAQLLTPKTSTLGLFATDLKTGFQEILLWAKQIFLTYTL